MRRSPGQRVEDALLTRPEPKPEPDIAGHWFCGTWVPTTQPEPEVTAFQPVTPRYHAVA